jgi:glycosyltransferase involved in cell wall biosynthesis
MIIAFVHDNKAFLPGLKAYSQFFTNLGVDCRIVDEDELKSTHRDVEWHFLGKDVVPPKEGVIKIHEYASASVPPFKKWKDFVKSFINAQPDFRIFQNAYVEKCLNFKDEVPSGYRDVGIPSNWLLPTLPFQKEYDFIYTGSVEKNRSIEKLLNLFTGKLSRKTLLVVSKAYENLASEYSQYKNIFFKGPAEKEQVRLLILKSRFAINYIPDLEPFNQQTSTKFLEYLTCKTPVISTRYPWIEAFVKKEGGQYFWLDETLDNLDWEVVNAANYTFPDLQEWTWEKQIRKSGVLEFLESRVEGFKAS